MNLDPNLQSLIIAVVTALATYFFARKPGPAPAPAPSPAPSSPDRPVLDAILDILTKILANRLPIPFTEAAPSTQSQQAVSVDVGQYVLHSDANGVRLIPKG